MIQRNPTEFCDHRIKIIHISTSLANGGLQNMMIDIANEQYLSGHHVLIIIVNKNVDVSILDRITPGINVCKINRTRGKKNVFSFLKLFFTLNVYYRYDIIHAHGTYIGQLLKYMTKKKIVHTVHGFNHALQPLNYYDQVFAISNAVKNYIELNSSVNPKVVYNGINIKKIKTRKPGKNIVGLGLRLVNVGRLDHEKKGQDILLYALSHLTTKKSLDVKIKLDFVGDGKSRKYLEGLSATLGLIDIVSFIGNQPREWVYEHLSDYDLFIQPSRHEGFGLTVAESMAAKVPVIVAHNDGPAEIIAEGRYGVVFKNGNSEDLADKILHVIELYKSASIKLIVEEAYHHCINNFSIKATAFNYIAEYKRILSK